MKDQFGRVISYARLSVTQRCNLRCIYCRPDACPETGDRPLLSVDDISRITRILAELGIGKIRLTGGEPLLRRDLADIVRAVGRVEGIRDLSLTTNGQDLAERAAELKAAGLMRVNISVDSLEAGKFSRLTGGGSLPKVLAAIDACLAVGLTPLKLNAVIMRGINDDEIQALVGLTRLRPLSVRFIELMPLNGLGRNPDRQISGGDILARLPDLQPLSRQDPGQAAELFQMPGYAGTVGIIRPVSHRFCGSCNRIRITADGMLKPCLGDDREISLTEGLRRDDGYLADLIRRTIWQKPPGHHFDENFQPRRSMNLTGG